MTRYGSHTESRMRETCTYGSMRGRAYPTTRGAPLYSTHHVTNNVAADRNVTMSYRKGWDPFKEA